MIPVVRSYKHRTINATPSPCWAESGHSWGSFAKVCVQLCKPMGKVTQPVAKICFMLRPLYALCDNEDRENRSKSRCFCQTHGRDFLAAHTWQSALAARFYGNEAQEGSSGPFRTLKEFARLRRGSAARNYGKIGDLCDKAQ